MVQWINDAGHGGTDGGASYGGNVEKVYTLEAATYVNRRLADHGIGSDLTRSIDTTLTNSARTAKTRTGKKAISHHYNAGGGSGAEAIHSIYGDGSFERIIIEELKKAGYPVRPNPVYSRKGTRGDYYYMHRDTEATRVTIMEYDFVDGPQSDEIQNRTYREGMYECVVKAICRDEGITYKPLQPVKTAVTPAPTGQQPSEWAVKDIEEAKALGISDGSRPLDTMTRQEGIAMIMRAFRILKG